MALLSKRAARREILRPIALEPARRLLQAGRAPRQLAAGWRRAEHRVLTVEITTLANDRGQTWDIRLLRPRASP